MRTRSGVTAGNAARRAALLLALLAACRYDADKIPSFSKGPAPGGTRGDNPNIRNPVEEGGVSVDASVAPHTDTGLSPSDGGESGAGDGSAQMDASIAPPDAEPVHTQDARVDTGVTGCDGGFIELIRGGCQDIDECAQSGVCPPEDFCENTAGGYVCTPCPSGYQRVLDRCENIDECERNFYCDPVAFCTDRDGSYDCRCPAYYADPGPIPGRQCLDSRRQLLAALPGLPFKLFIVPTGNEYLLALAIVGAGTVLDGTPHSEQDGAEMLLARVDANFSVQWLDKRPGLITLSSAHVDSRGDLVVGGTGDSGFDLGQGPIDSGDELFQFIAKYGGVDGAPLWSKVVRGVERTAVGSASVDSDDNVLLCGSGGSLQADQTEYSFADSLYLAKLSRDGDLRWVRAWPEAAFADCTTVAVNANDEIFIGGDFTDSIVFDRPLTAPSGRGTFVAKVAADGLLRWAAQLSGNSRATLTRIAVDHEGNPIIVGAFEGSFDTGDREYRSFGDWDAFIAGRKPDGTPSWSLRIGSQFEDMAQAVDVGPAGEFAVVGHFGAETDFGEGPRPVAGVTDAFIQLYSAARTLLWHRALGGIAHDAADRVVIDNQGRLLVTSWHAIGPDFDEGMLDGGSGTLVNRFEP